MPDRILVVEDEGEYADLLGLLLTKRGYETKVAYCGKDAMEAAPSFLPDIILQDYMLPDINGVDLLARLKRACPETNLIVMTAKGNEDVAVDSMKAGASDYLKKPFDIDKLLTTIENTLKLRSSQETFRKLRQELRVKNNELMALNAISSALVSTMTLGEKYNTAVGILRKKMKADVAGIFTINEYDRNPALVAAEGFMESASAECNLSNGKGLVLYAAGLKIPVVVADFRKEERFEVPAEFLDQKFVSGLAAPLLIKDIVTGVLAVYYMNEHSFNSFEMDLIGNFANLIALLPMI